MGVIDRHEGSSAPPEPAVAPNAGAGRVIPERRPIVATGRGVGEGVATGLARYIHAAADLAALRPGEILMAQAVEPGWATETKGISALVVNAGDPSGVAAALARKFAIPAVVGTVDGASPAWTGATLMVCAEEGGAGVVYECRGPSA